MPIKDLSESVRLPRLGKIHLGIKAKNAQGVEYPKKTDYFVLPEDHSDYKKLVKAFGEKPKELRILIPVEDEEQWATQYYKSYNQTYGLVCKGDGDVALRMVDISTKELPDAKKHGTVTLKEIECKGRDCLEYQTKKCHEVMNLKFLIPEVPGLGVWQIDTGSKNSILNINSCAKIIKRAFGRISLIPLKLTFEPIQVNNPEDGRKQTVYVLNLRTDVTLAQLADQAKEQAKMFMIEAPDLEAMADMQIEKDIDDLWGEKPKADVTTGEITEPKEQPQTKGEYAEKPKSQKTAVADEPEPENHPEIPPEDTETTGEPFKPEPSPIDLDWLDEQLKTLQEKGLKTWNKAGMLNALSRLTGEVETDIHQAVRKLTPEQAKKVTDKIQEALELA